MPYQDKNSANRSPRSILTSDTSPEVERMQVGLWRGMSPLEKARIVGRVSRAVQQLSIVGIRQRHPSASEHECRMYYAELTLGRSLAREAYPEAATLRGS